MAGPPVTYAVVPTIEGGQAKLTVLPQHWTKTNGWIAGVKDSQTDYRGSDVMYWPINAAGRNLADMADTDVLVFPDENCRAYRCAIKRNNLKNRADVSVLILISIFKRINNNSCFFLIV